MAILSPANLTIAFFVIGAAVPALVAALGALISR